MTFKFFKSVVELKHSLTCLLAFCIPLAQSLSTVILIVLTLLSIITLRKNAVTFSKHMGLFMVFYGIYIGTMFLHPPVDITVFEKKLALLAIPIIFFTTEYSNRLVKKIFKFFVFGCLVAVFYCLVFAVFNSTEIVDGHLRFNSIVNPTVSNGLVHSISNGGNYFFGNYFSQFHQTVYFSMYLNIAIIGLLKLGYFKFKINVVPLVIFISALFLISNKVNIFLCVLLLLVYAITTIKTRYKKIIFCTIVLILGVSISLTNPRIKTMIGNAYKQGIQLNNETTSSYGTRLLVWDASLELLKTSKTVFFTGVGVSNTYDALKKMYKKNRYITPYRERLNSHNQFLQLNIETGILGVLILVLITLNFYKNLPVKHRALGLMIITVFMVNFFFESVLNRYSGLSCFVFIVTLFNQFKSKTVSFQRQVA